MEALSYQTGPLSRPARTQLVAGIATAELDSHRTITDSNYKLEPCDFPRTKTLRTKGNVFDNYGNPRRDQKQKLRLFWAA
jgi:hypothetical protein